MDRDALQVPAHEANGIYKCNDHGSASKYCPIYKQISSRWVSTSELSFSNLWCFLVLQLLVFEFTFSMYALFWMEKGNSSSTRSRSMTFAKWTISILFHISERNESVSPNANCNTIQSRSKLFGFWTSQTSVRFVWNVTWNAEFPCLAHSSTYSSNC